VQLDTHYSKYLKGLQNAQMFNGVQRTVVGVTVTGFRDTHKHEPNAAVYRVAIIYRPTVVLPD
jgi:hypothetical protein